MADLRARRVRNPLRGCLVLNYTGAGTELTALVVTGEQRGAPWIVNDAFYPLRTRSFVAWVESMLDAEL